MPVGRAHTPLAASFDSFAGDNAVDIGHYGRQIVGVEDVEIAGRRRQELARLIAVAADVARQVNERMGRLSAEPVEQHRAVFDDATGIRQGLEIARAPDAGADQLGERLECVDFDRRPDALVLAIVETQLTPPFVVDENRNQQHRFDVRSRDKWVRNGSSALRVSRPSGSPLARKGTSRSRSHVVSSRPCLRVRRRGDTGCVPLKPKLRGDSAVSLFLVHVELEAADAAGPTDPFQHGGDGLIGRERTQQFGRAHGHGFADGVGARDFLAPLHQLVGQRALRDAVPSVACRFRNRCLASTAPACTARHRRPVEGALSACAGAGASRALRILFSASVRTCGT